MDSQKLFWITPEEYCYLDKNKISQIFLLDGTILEIYNNYNFIKNYDIMNNYIYPEINEYKRHKKSTSFDNINGKNINKVKSYFVTSVENEPSVIIPVKFLEEDNFDNKFKKSIVNFTFESEPHKYIYKPYKTPERKHKLRIENNNNKKSKRK